MWLQEQNLLSSTADQLRLWENVKSFQSSSFNLTSDANGILIQDDGRWVDARYHVANMEKANSKKVLL